MKKQQSGLVVTSETCPESHYWIMSEPALEPMFPDCSWVLSVCKHWEPVWGGLDSGHVEEVRWWQVWIHGGEGRALRRLGEGKGWAEWE